MRDKSLSELQNIGMLVISKLFSYEFVDSCISAKKCRQHSSYETCFKDPLINEAHEIDGCTFLIFQHHLSSRLDDAMEHDGKIDIPGATLPAGAIMFPAKLLSYQTTPITLKVAYAYVYHFLKLTGEESEFSDVSQLMLGQKNSTFLDPKYMDRCASSEKEASNYEKAHADYKMAYELSGKEKNTEVHCLDGFLLAGSYLSLNPPCNTDYKRAFEIYKDIFVVCQDERLKKTVSAFIDILEPQLNSDSGILYTKINTKTFQQKNHVSLFDQYIEYLMESQLTNALMEEIKSLESTSSIETNVQEQNQVLDWFSYGVNALSNYFSVLNEYINGPEMTEMCSTQDESFHEGFSK